MRPTGADSVIVTGGVHSSLAVKVQKKKKQATIKTKIDGKPFKIPVNPEDEADFIPYNSSAVDAQRKYGLRKRTNGSRHKKVCFNLCWRLCALFIVGSSNQSQLTRS
jgi:hypothetical protein